MKSLTDRRIAIIGRGIAGLALAYRLSQRGAQPLVFGSAPASASRCAQGVVANKGLIFFQSPLFAAKLQSLLHIQDWLSSLERQSGLNIPRRFQGLAEPYWSEDDFQDLSTRIYRQRFWGCHMTRNRAAVHGPQWPFARRLPLGYLLYPNDGWFDVSATLAALERVLSQAGLSFIEESVQHIEADTDGPLHLRTADGLRHSFDQVIIAAGSGTPELFAASGLTLPKMFTIGGQTLELEIEHLTAEPQTLVRKTLSATWTARRILLGSTSWKGSAISSDDLERDTQALLQASDENFGLDLRSKKPKLRNRVGSRLRFADRMPAVGSWPLPPWRERLFLCTGFYKSGLQLADLCALDLISCIEGSAENIRYPDFSPERLFKN